MNRAVILWPATALVIAAAGFFTVRGLAPAGSDASRVAGATAGSASGSRSSADLEAALAVASQDEDALTRRLRFLEVVEKADPLELRRMFLSGHTSRREKRHLAQRWAETAPADLCNFLKSLSRAEWDHDGEQFDTVRDILFRTWAAQDADAALSALASLEHRPQFRNARWEIMQTLFGLDPAQGFAAAAGLPRWARGSRLAETSWQNNPAAFLTAAGEAPPASFRNYQVQEAVGQAFAEWVKQNPTAAATWLKELSPEQQRRWWGRLTLRLAEGDLAGAQAWFNDLPPSAAREQAGAAIVNAWAKQNPRAALEWLQDNLEGGRTAAFGHLASALAEQGIEAAQQLLDAMPPGAQRDQVVASIAQEWAAKDAKAAAGWLLTLPSDDPGRRRAIQQISYQWAQADLEGAATFVRENAQREEGRDMLWTVTQQYEQKNFAAGLEWAAGLQGTLQSQAFMSFYHNAVHSRKTAEILAHLEKLPTERQEAVVEKLTEGILQTTYSDLDQDTRFVNSLKQWPESLRGIARQTIERFEGLRPGRQQAALEALK